eukprot:scaffold1435_cov267-Pinguiococcus_pyrenoidosus.AAC.30
MSQAAAEQLARELDQELFLDDETGHDVVEVGGLRLGVPDGDGFVYARFSGDAALQEVMALVDRELSEPYSIYTYRYFLMTWPEHCLVVRKDDRMIGCVVCKLEQEAFAFAGYIAMLVVEKDFRGFGIGSQLVVGAIDSMRRDGAEEVVLETEVTNKAALRLYERLGFSREERLFRYYLNNNDAFRLKLWLK